MANRVKPLSVVVSPGDPRPIVRQISDAIRLQITTTALEVGDMLPSVRGLAQQLKINPNTVAKSYAQLTSEGWLESRAGLGIFVAVRRDQFNNTEVKRRLDEAVDRYVSEIIAIRYPPEEALEAVAIALAALKTRKSA